MIKTDVLHLAIQIKQDSMDIAKIARINSIFFFLNFFKK